MIPAEDHAFTRFGVASSWRLRRGGRFTDVGSDAERSSQIAMSSAKHRGEPYLLWGSTAHGGIMAATVL
jgi:hypothetical protein